MIKNYFLIAVFLIVGAVCRPHTQRKCSPMQWESFVAGQDVQEEQGKQQKYDFIGMYSVDYDKQHDVLFELVSFQGKLIGNYTVLRTQKITYFADNMNKRCQTMPGATIERWCTDLAGLTYLNSWTLGDQMTDTYGIDINGRRGTFTFIRDSFTPAVEAFEQSLVGTSQNVAMQYGNVTSGIKDPSVFNLPTYC